MGGRRAQPLPSAGRAEVTAALRAAVAAVVLPTLKVKKGRVRVSYSATHVPYAAPEVPYTAPRVPRTAPHVSYAAEPQVSATATHRSH
jgi:hypothetical protein